MSDIMMNAWRLLLPKLWKSSGMGINEILEIDFGTSSDGIDVVRYFNETLGLLNYDSGTGKFFPLVNYGRQVGEFVWKPISGGIKTVADFVRYRNKLDAWRELGEKTTHARARALLYKMPLEKSFSGMGAQRLGAVAHYLKCRECRKVGLAKIRNTQLEHRKAILVWAKRFGYLPKEKPSNLMDVYAAEHLLSCKAFSCMALRSYWDNYVRQGLEEHEEEAQAHLYPVLLEIFARTKWPMDELFALYCDRAKLLLKGLDKNHQEEVLALVDSLQSVANLPRIWPMRKKKEKNG
ncbi:MAG: hypothetical protein WEC39_02030 [Patescibacteria group bacterium]